MRFFFSYQRAESQYDTVLVWMSQSQRWTHTTPEFTAVLELYYKIFFFFFSLKGFSEPANTICIAQNYEVTTSNLAANKLDFLHRIELSHDQW